MKRAFPVSVILLLLSGQIIACKPSPIRTEPSATSTPAPTATLAIGLEEVAVRVCKNEGFPQAAEYIENRLQKHKIFILGSDGKEHSWNSRLSPSVKAQSVGELEAVVCLGEEHTIRAVSCGKYTWEASGISSEIFLSYYEITAAMVAARSGQLIREFDITGFNDGCPPDRFSTANYALIGDSHEGSPVSFENFFNALVMAWKPPATFTPVPTQTPRPTAIVAPGPSVAGPSVAGWYVDFVDDFTGQYPDWETQPDETLENGVLRWEVNNLETVYKTRTAEISRFSNDQYARLVVRHTTGAETDGYGLMFGRQDDNIHMAFLIYDDGTFELQSVNSIEYPDELSRRATAAIRPGDWNTLEVTQLDKRIYLSINGIPVAEMDFTKYIWGQIGLAVLVEGKSEGEPAAIFEFDELEARWP